MLVPKKASASRVTFSLILIIIIIAVSGYVLYDRFVKTDEIVDNDSLSDTVTPRQATGISTDFSSGFISQAPYADLVQNGKLPVQASATGRSNPFSEIPFSLLSR